MSDTDDNRSLEQRLIEYLFPKSGPQDAAAKAYGVSEGDRIALSHLPEHVQQQLIRLCDANPVCAVDLIRLSIDIYDHGRDEAFLEAVHESAEATKAAVENWYKLL